MDSESVPLRSRGPAGLISSSARAGGYLEPDTNDGGEDQEKDMPPNNNNANGRGNRVRGGGAVARYKGFLLVLCALAIVQMLGGYLYFYGSEDAVGRGDLRNYLPFLPSQQAHQTAGGGGGAGGAGDAALPCRSVHKDARSALERATDPECRRTIGELACKNEAKELYPDRLKNLCPVKLDPEMQGLYLGCFADSFDDRLLVGAVATLKTENDKEACVKLCSESGFTYAGTQYKVECFCGNERPDDERKAKDESECSEPCPGNKEQRCGGYLTMNVYQTGLIPFQAAPTASQERREEEAKLVPARVVYLLTVSGRSVRQVRRLIKRLYHTNNYIFIHVDSRQDFMHRELSALERKFPNIRMVRKRYATIWGGASLLQMLVNCMKELLELDWEWDFVLNLSESDYPMKPAERLVEFLTLNKGRNFVRSHGRETSVFIRKQGLDKTFYECDNHMWRLGPRKLPAGIQMDGGSDWICLHRDFARYVVHGHDEMIDGLRTVFEYTLLPAEAFFHVALRNSPFCSTTVNNNLHLTNWRRKQGCKCQHKAIVDWCGCSPNDFKPEDWGKINATAGRDTFFARKFEAIVNQRIINRVDEWIMGKDHDFALTGRQTYWENIYHHLDLSPKVRPELLTLTKAIALRHLDSLELQGLSLGKVEEVTLTNHKDAFEGVLILYEVVDSAGEGVAEVEVLVKPKETTVKTTDGSTFSVGTDFDPKEVLFRNKIGAMGPSSEPLVMYKWKGSSEAKLTFVALSPSGETSFVHEQAFPNTTQEDTTKLELPRPLLPGAWHLLVLDGEEVVAHIPFLVTPVLPESFSPAVSDGEVLEANAGSPAQLFPTDYFTLLSRTVQGLPERAALKASADDGSKLLGEALVSRVKDLSSDFYPLHPASSGKACLASGRLPAASLPGCRSTLWSSQAEDPKSEISGLVDPRTGRLP